MFSLNNNYLSKKETLIRRYFYEGYTLKEIVDFLMVSHGISLSKRTLKRILKSLNLKKKNVESPLEEVCELVIKELNGSGSCLGYKMLWKRLRSKYGLNVKRETVLNILREVDPEGIDKRKKHRLRRRQYVVPGPNFLWHLDGYDKLKPFGFAIHGCIDGYSRKLLWLQVASTNNNPRVIAHYYLSCVRQLNCVPTLLRGDKGTENSLVASLQKFLRLDHQDKLSGMNSYIEGKSTSNQRIECFWSQMRKMGIDWWISFFKDLRDGLFFNDSDQLQIEMLRFCFGHLIQMDLNNIINDWNRHTIRKQKNVELPTGKPNYLYHCCEKLGTRDYKKPINEEDLNVCLNMYTSEPKLCSPLFTDLVTLVNSESESHAIAVPTNIDEAVDMYCTLQKVFKVYDYSDD